jgi:hypothetical protein
VRFRATARARLARSRRRGSAVPGADLHRNINKRAGGVSRASRFRRPKIRILIREGSGSGVPHGLPGRGDKRGGGLDPAAQGPSTAATHDDDWRRDAKTHPICVGSRRCPHGMTLRDLNGGLADPSQRRRGPGGHPRPARRRPGPGPGPGRVPLPHALLAAAVDVVHGPIVFDRGVQDRFQRVAHAQAAGWAARRRRRPAKAGTPARPIFAIRSRVVSGGRFFSAAMRVTARRIWSG